MEQPLAGRVAIVTGASAGIGRAVAEELVAAGCRVVVNARRADRLASAVADLNRHAREPAAAIAVGDAAEQATIESMFEVAAKEFGGADAVVVNAGRGLAGSVATSDTAEWEEMVRTNLLGAARLMREAAHRFGGVAAPGSTPVGPSGDWLRRPRDIVVIGSVVGRHVSPFSSMYGSTKFAVHGLAEGLRREVGPRGVRVTLVEPGFVVSEFQGVAGYKQEWFDGVVEKIGPVLRPADVARVVSFAMAQPAHVHIGDVLVRPTRQDYP